MQQTTILSSLQSVSYFLGSHQTTNHDKRLTVKHVFWLTIGLYLSSLTVSAQKIAPDPREMVFTIVEQSPEYPGGFQVMRDYLKKQTHYPDSAAKAGIIGRVFISFIVEPDGQLTNITLLKGLGFGCDEEAIRVIEAMPRWNPGRQSGRAIRVKYNLPIAFGVK